MARYKLMRYTPDNIKDNNTKDKKMSWQQVDYELREAMQ
jgi:hypothetical protein